MRQHSLGRLQERGRAGALTLWRESLPRQLGREQYRELGRRAGAAGESLIACDIVTEGLRIWTHDKQLRQIQALALARMGSHERAHEILAQIRREGHHDEETLGLIARTYKDVWLSTHAPSDLKYAYDAYAKAYEHSPRRYWTGINAATLAFAMRKVETARRLAAVVRDVCLRKLPMAPGGEKYWLAATAAEAALLLNQMDEAERWYSEANRLGQNDFGHLSATWRNARIILRFMPPDAGVRVRAALRVPYVVVFTGHRVDEPGSISKRFPAEFAANIKRAIKDRLIQSNSRVGYSSAASGADILFIEAMQSLGGRTHIILPCSEEQFIKESVVSSGIAWVRRFRRVITKANEVITASPQRPATASVAYGYTNDLLHGLAIMRADELATELVHLAVWDRQPAYSPGGTGDAVRRWQAAGSAVDIINPSELMRPAVRVGRARLPPFRSAARIGIKVPGFASEVRAMVFADAYHFSKLSEQQMPAFIREFMGPIAALASRTKPAPTYQNTWGDGLFFAFREADSAAYFALSLAGSLTGRDWKAAGLPADMSLRIALHAGPVYRFKDKITRQMNYIGWHVNRAARIEPVTPPGQIYASHAFAALATLQAPEQFRFDYVGKIPLAKDFGEFPMYRLQAR